MILNESTARKATKEASTAGEDDFIMTYKHEEKYMQTKVHA